MLFSSGVSGSWRKDEAYLIRRGAVLAESTGIYLGMVLASWHLKSTPPLENEIVLIQPKKSCLGIF